MLPDHAPARPLDSKEEALQAVSYRGGPHVNDMRVHAHAHVSHGETAPFALSWRAHTDIRNGHQKRLLDTPFPLRGVREVPTATKSAQIGYWKPPLPNVAHWRRCFSLAADSRRACCRATQTQRGADGPTDGVRLPRSGYLRADAEQQPSAARLSKPPGRSNTFSAAATARARPAASYVDWAAARLGREQRRDEQPLGCSGWSAEAAARAAHHAGRQYLPGAAMR
jgi:hypothetical protein